MIYDIEMRDVKVPSIAAAQTRDVRMRTTVTAHGRIACEFRQLLLYVDT